MSTTDTLYRQARARMQAHFGMNSVITIPRPLVELTGDLNTAALLNQILFYSSLKEDGWFYMRYVDWKQELGLSEYQVRRSVKALMGLNLGLATDLRKVDGAPTVHYRIDPPVFFEAFDRYLEQQDLQNPFLRNFRMEAVETLASMDTEETSASIYTESPERSNLDSNQGAADTAPVDEDPPAPDPDPFADPVPDEDVELDPPPRRGKKKAVRPPESEEEQHLTQARFSVIARYAFNVIDRSNVDSETRGRVNHILKMIREAFPDRPPGPVAITNAFLHYKKTKPKMNVPRMGSTIVTMLNDWKAAGYPDYTEPKPQHTRPLPPPERWEEFVMFGIPRVDCQGRGLSPERFAEMRRDERERFKTWKREHDEEVAKRPGYVEREDCKLNLPDWYYETDEEQAEPA